MRLRKERFLALVLVSVMVFTMMGLVKNDSTASAASPTVTSDGATIRLVQGTTKQGLRFKMTINNYDLSNLEDFGMKLTMAGKSDKVVSFKNGYTNLYSNDNEGTVEYTVVITGIPAASMGTDIVATPFVTEKEKSQTDGTAMTKNVRDVAFAANYMIADDGTLEAFTGSENVTTLSTAGWGKTKQIKYLNAADYTDQYLKFTFKLRRAPGVSDLTLTNGIQGAINSTYPIVVKGPFTISDEWVSCTGYFDKFLETNKTYPVNIYFDAANATDTIYMKDFTMTNAAHSVYFGNEAARTMTAAAEGEAYKTLFTKNGADYGLTTQYFSKVRIDATYYKDSEVVTPTTDNCLWVTVASSDNWGANKEAQGNCLSGVSEISGTNLKANTIAFQKKIAGNTDYDKVIINSIKLID